VITAAVDRSAAGDTMFVGHPNPVTTRDLLEGVRAASGGRGTIVRIPLVVTRLAALGGDAVGALFGTRTVINSRRYAELASEGFVCRVERLRDRLGVSAQIDLRAGLADAYAWYRREGWL
jgi:nucleoside-diphosphate-sugar epimerase